MDRLPGKAQMITEDRAASDSQAGPQKKAQGTVSHNVIEFARQRPTPPDPGPQPPVGVGKINQHTRRSFISMFLVGSGVRKVAQFYDTSESKVEGALRERLIEGGAFNDRKAA